MLNTHQSESHEVKAIAFRGRIVLKQIQEQKTTTDLLALILKKHIWRKVGTTHHLHNTIPMVGAASCWWWWWGPL